MQSMKSWNEYRSSMEKKIQNSVGTSTQELFYNSAQREGIVCSAVVANCVVHVLMDGPNPIWSSLGGGHPTFSRRLKSPLLLTNLKSLVMSINVIYVDFYCSRQFSCS